MEVNIKVSEITAGTTLTGLAGAPAATGISNANDGGAPAANQYSGSQGASAGGSVDMGGPPQWLKDAIGSAGNHNAAADSTAAGSGTDAGAAPSFG